MTNETPQFDKRGHWSVARPVAQFAVVGIVALAIVGVATYFASRRVGEHEAISDAQSQTVFRAVDVVQPVVSESLLTGDRAAVRVVDDIVRRSVLDDSLVRVKIWTASGTIVYSDEARLIGTQYQLGQEELATLANGSVEAEVSDLNKPENRFERDRDKLLEVYLPIHTPGGTAILFEAYFRYDAVTKSGDRVWRNFAPFTIGSLLLLELIQIPLAWRLARRLQQRRRERERLLQRAVEASDRERRRIAADLHDGVVQDLVGVSLSLASRARTPNVDPSAAALLDDAAIEVRKSIKALRSLLIDIYPPNLFDEGLPAALDDLLARGAGRGIATEVDTSLVQRQLDPTIAGLLYRVAQEATRNVLAHSNASAMKVTAGTTERTAWIEVSDDGKGFDVNGLQSMAASGHFGIRGLSDLVRDAGGELTVSSQLSGGTTVRAELGLP